MIGYYLSINNKMCYDIKTNNFSPIKQDLNYNTSDYIAA